MPKWIKPSRVRAAVQALAEWRTEAKSQFAMHLWPLLALIEAGVTTSDFKPFTEQSEKDFWDAYFRLPGENRPKTAGGGFTPDYYIDPLVLSKKPADYPHRGPWTIRTRTFLNSWRAVAFESEMSSWRLEPSFASKFQVKALRKDGVLHRVPVVDLAAWLFRYEEFNDDATASTLEQRFRTEFPFGDSDYNAIFEFVLEDTESIFTEDKPRPDEYVAEINDALVDPTLSVAVPPNEQGEDTADHLALTDDDPIMMRVRQLLSLGTSGIILRGCPGTSKTWYAKRIARTLVGDPASDIFQVQFHPSLGYEDFVEGYRPDNSTRAGFTIIDKVFFNACKRAADLETPVVVIIDEINRGDPARILGELLTYLARIIHETSKGSTLCRIDR